jgi:hypothetical protein
VHSSGGITCRPTDFPGLLSPGISPGMQSILSSIPPVAGIKAMKVLGIEDLGSPLPP